MIPFFLAQSTDLPQVPAETFKWVIIIIVALILITCAVLVAWASLRRPAAIKIDDNPPPQVSKAPKRFNFELAEQRYQDHERRLLALEGWQNDLLQKLDDDKMEMLKAGEERASRIHSHIEADRREIDRKIEAIPNNVIATLKNTGAI